MIDYKKLIKYIIIPLGIGVIVGLLTGANGAYEEFVKPEFSPPAILFPIVWSILYILMGVSSYLVSESNNVLKDNALLYYYAQLVVNFLWSFVFFSFKWYLFAFIWLLLLIVLVVLMIIKFYRVNRTSAYLQIPYLFWILFAAVLNYAVYTLN